MNKFWTPKNDELLRTAYAAGGWESAQQIFSDQHRMAIVTRARQIGVKPPFVSKKPAKAAVGPKLTREQRLDAKIAAKKAEIARLASQRDSIAADEARRAAERAERAKNRTTGVLEARYAATIRRADELRAKIVAVKPGFTGPTFAAQMPAAAEAQPIVAPTGPLKPTVDKGDTEIIRKRLMNFTVPQLVRDLRIAGPAVLACIEQLAKDARR